jgi:hypothetical protein
VRPPRFVAEKLEDRALNPDCRETQYPQGPIKGVRQMSIGLVLIIILVIFLLGGFSGRFGGYGYGYGHGGIGVIGIILVILVVLLLLGRL